jgi:Uma2 family endonuclease
MSTLDSPSRPFEPGTTGWTARDLDDPAIEREWFKGRYEIVEGVLTKMPPAYFSGGESLFKLMLSLQNHFSANGPPGSFSFEVDIIIDDARVAVADAVFLTDAERMRQTEASQRAGRSDPDRTRILVPPTMVIESVSPGHELHDRRTKRRWYAEFGVPNYWILDAYQPSLECLRLEGATYQTLYAGTGGVTFEVAPFGGLTIQPSDIWRSR